MPQKKPRHIVLTSWYVLYASWSSFQHEVPYNQCMEEHHHCFFYLRVFTSLRADRSFPDSSSSQQRKKNKCLAMMLQESLGAQLRTQCSVRSCLLAKVPSRMITSILHNAWKNIAIPQCLRWSRDHSCTGPFTMLALKQRSHVNRSFHDACCVCWERFCTKIAMEFWLGSFNQISRLFHHNRAKTFAHWSNSLHTRRANCEVSKGSRRSLPLSVPLSFCNVSVPISHLFSTKSEYYKNVAI